MFGSGKKPLSSDKIDTLVGKGTNLEGNINAEGTIRIDGRIHGGINISGNLIVGEEGHVKGNVKVGSAFIAGTVEGNVMANAQLHLTHTGRLMGDITVKNIIIDEGAIFIGNCKIIIENQQQSNA